MLSEQQPATLPETPTAPGDSESISGVSGGSGSGRPFKTLYARLGETSRQTSLLFSAQSGSLLFGFASSLLQARFMERAEMGRFAFCLSIIVIIGLSFEFGISSAGARVLALEREHAGERSALGALLLLTLIIGAIFALFIIAVAGPIDLIFHKDVRWILVATAGLAFFQPLQPFVEQCCQGLNQIRRLSAFHLLMSGTYLASMTALAFTGRLNAGTALAGYLTGIAIASVWTIIGLRPTLVGSGHFLKLTLKETRRFGLNLYVARVAGLLSSRADQLVIAYFIKEAAPLGMYAIVQKFANPIMMAGRSLATARFRSFARADAVSRRINRWNAVLLVGAAVVLVIAGPVAIKLFFPRYAEASWLLVPFAIASVFAGLFQPYNVFLASQGRGRELRNVVAVVSIASFAGLIVMVPRYGIGGAAWVASAVMALDYLLHLHYYRLFKQSLSKQAVIK
ncbi:MAG TPA: lipopolysaccharide biosynthesis protein [Blastocatellia bacterium]|nr:lipopolysaccharide biosynthesis protein [Blastocatellia bacterium]